MSRALALALVLTAPLAHAEDIGQTWSIIGPRTIAPNDNAFEFGAGWPGVSAAWVHGVGPGLNLGARASFDYGVEGLVRQIAPGIKVQATLKLRFLDTERVSLGLTFEPGPLFHFPQYGSTLIGFSLPIGLRLGIAASPAFSLALLVEVPLWIQFGVTGGLQVPILSGVGLEYFVTSTLGVFVRARVGPTIRPYSTELAFDGTVGVGFKL
jgi:hypothetical protein